MGVWVSGKARQWQTHSSTSSKAKVRASASVAVPVLEAPRGDGPLGPGGWMGLSHLPCNSVLMAKYSAYDHPQKLPSITRLARRNNRKCSSSDDVYTPSPGSSLDTAPFPEGSSASRK